MAESLLIKVGGSLFDMPDLADRLRAWLGTLGTRRLILLPGGGGAANVIREFDRVHRLGEEKSHWLALRAVTLNAHVLAELLPGSRVAGSLQECTAAHESGLLPIIDAWQFMMEDETQPDHLPHRWNVTSDSVAARVALRGGARRLILLKSVDMPERIDWAEAGRRGYVDTCFGELAQRAKDTLSIETVNLRAPLRTA